MKTPLLSRRNHDKGKPRRQLSVDVSSQGLRHHGGGDRAYFVIGVDNGIAQIGKKARGMMPEDKPVEAVRPPRRPIHEGNIS